MPALRPGFRSMRGAMLGLAALCAVEAGAQQVNPVSVANAPAADPADDAGSASSPSADEGGKAIDVGGLSGRGGTALRSRSSFRETIGTPIYAPIGTPMFTPVQRPPETNGPG